MREDVALITLDDGKANTLSHESIAALREALSLAESESRAVVLSGRPGFFCAGFDLKLARAGHEAMRGLVAAGADMLMQILSFPQPVLMACTGHAMAMGAVMLLSADVCIGAEGPFKIGLNEVSIGMPLPAFVVELARSRLSPRHFFAATCNARIYDPIGAVQAGYLDRICSPEGVVDQTVAEAGNLGKILVPEALKITKQYARSAIINSLRSTLSRGLSSFELFEG